MTPFTVKFEPAASCVNVPVVLRTMARLVLKLPVVIKVGAVVPAFGMVLSNVSAPAAPRLASDEIASVPEPMVQGVVAWAGAPVSVQVLSPVFWNEAKF